MIKDTAGCRALNRKFIVTGENKWAIDSNSLLYINGEQKYLKAYTIGDTNYFKLRDIAACIDFNVSWNEKSQMIILDPSSSYIYE